MRSRTTFRRSTRIGAAILLVAGIGVAISGDVSGQDHDRGAAHEDGRCGRPLRPPRADAPFSILTVGSLDGEQEKFAIIEIPGLLSFLGTGSFNGEVKGINDLRAEYKSTVRLRPGRGVLLAGRLHADHPGDLLVASG